MSSPSERATTESDRGTADRGTSHAEDASRAGVQSIIRSGPHRGRLVFDPARRWTPPPRVPTTTGEILSVERLPVNNRTPSQKPRSRPFPERSPSEKVTEYVFDEPTEVIALTFPPLPKKFHNYPGDDWADKTFRELKEIRDIIHEVASGDPVLALAIAGAYGAEFDTLGLIDREQDEAILKASQVRFERDRLHLRIRFGPNYLEKILFHDPWPDEKLGNYFLNDIGPANFRIATAAYLIKEDWLRIKVSDPKKYYPGLVKILNSRRGTVKAAAAWIKYGRKEFERLGVMKHIPVDLQAAVLVHWYREGPRIFERFRARWELDRNALPTLDPKDEYMHNRERIVEAIR